MKKKNNKRKKKENKSEFNRPQASPSPIFTLATQPSFANSSCLLVCEKIRPSGLAGPGWPNDSVRFDDFRTVIVQVSHY